MTKQEIEAAAQDPRIERVVNAVRELGIQQLIGSEASVHVAKIHFRRAVNNCVHPRFSITATRTTSRQSEKLETTDGIV